MNFFDEYVIGFLNRAAQRSWAFDEFVSALGTNYLVKTVPLLILLYWAWFQEDQKRDDRREFVVFGLTASCFAVLFARALSFVLPFRERPLRNPDLHFVLPHSVGLHAIEGWSSFPSDNATLFFGVAACILLVSRPAGIFALCHTTVVVAISRVYLGYHYPTDILAGAAMGIGAVSLARVPAIRIAVTRIPMRWLRTHPQRFQTGVFVLIFLIATTFEPIYPLAHMVLAMTSTMIERLDEQVALVVLWTAAVSIIVAGAWLVSRWVRRAGHRPG